MPLSPRPYLQRVSFKPDAKLNFEAYPLNIPAVREIESIEFHSDVTFFVGENG
jgi:predicted ATPase